MKKYLEILKNTPLFEGLEEKEIELMLPCLKAKKLSFKKGEYVINAGERPDGIFLLAKGELIIQNDDYWGNRSIINKITTGELFGEAYVVPNSKLMPNDVVAFEDSVVLCFDAKKLLTVCSSACRFHSVVIQNLFFSLTAKNRHLVSKLSHMSKRTTREKLFSYLSEEAKRHNSNSFYIPFNRQQLADFLSVDRSAMSNELCKMRDMGLIDFHKNHFLIKGISH